MTCEVCGTSFDPTESRGWCPNPACGKWQHPDFPLSSGGQQEAADGGVQAPTKICPGCGKEIRADANFCKFCSHEFPEEEDSAVPAGGDDEEEGLDQCPVCDADLSSIPPGRLDDCPICGSDLADHLADRTQPDVSPAELEACPACHADLTDIPADMRRVCPECRVSLDEAIEEHGIGGPPESPAGADAGADETGVVDAGEIDAGAGEARSAGPGAGGGAAGGAAQADDAGEPDSATDTVDTIKGIGSSYADRLAEADVLTVGDLVR
ncbi:MAG: IBR domain-containing protein, partial [Haloarculaceae archaeon]